MHMRCFRKIVIRKPLCQKLQMPEEYLNRCCSITSQIKGNFICIFGKMQEGSFVKYRRGITLEQPVFLKSYNKGLWQDSRL